MVLRGSVRRGWFRIWADGPGISWRPFSEGDLFDERYGYVVTFRVGPWRVRCLPQETPCR